MRLELVQPQNTYLIFSETSKIMTIVILVLFSNAIFRPVHNALLGNMGVVGGTLNHGDEQVAMEAVNEKVRTDIISFASC